MSALVKNFSYGDLWQDVPEIPKDNHGIKKSDPADFTNNAAFINFLNAYGYDFYLDYDLNGLAYTDATNKKVVVNANYSNEMISVFLQHELGHLMLFDVDQFTTVKDDTLRSIMAKVIYTPKNLTDYGIEQILLAENIVQDIFIETFSNNNCVCNKSLALHSVNLGVKHLSEIESAKHIAQEVCETILKKPDDEEEQGPKCDPNELMTVLESMLKDLKNDIQEIEEKMDETKKTSEYQERRDYQRLEEGRKTSNKIDRVNDKLNRSSKSSSKIEKFKEKLEQQLKEITSDERIEQDHQTAENDRQRTLDYFNKKLEKAKELLEELERQKESAEGEIDNSSPGGNNSASSRSSKSHELHKNYTDRKEDPTGSAGGHSFDCGLPHPLTITREESYFNEQNFVKMDSKKRVRKIEIQEDNMNNVLSNRMKIPESEYTYFKSNKKEFLPSDMLQGKRRLRISGINVLVGLDISGSMVQEWGEMFVQLSEMIEKFQVTLDIENIVYFTYNQKLCEASTDLNDLELKADGGNAFGYVYQDIMQQLPIMQRNEIILVTDCGDNLGFKLDDNCVVERQGSKVENHISIIDTENAGFYQKQNFDENDWSLYHYSDPLLSTNLKNNIENLIER